MSEDREVQQAAPEAPRAPQTHQGSYAGRPQRGPRPEGRGGDRGGDRRGGAGRRRFGRGKVCAMCVEKVDYIDYKDIRRLRRFVSERGKLVSRRISGACSKHQRAVSRAIHRARFLALLPYKA